MNQTSNCRKTVEKSAMQLFWSDLLVVTRYCQSSLLNFSVQLK